MKSSLERINGFFGEKFIQCIKEGGDDIDFSELTVLNPEVLEDAKFMSDEWIKAEVDKLEKKASLLEEKINSGTMTLKERAEYDKHVPFSLKEHDYNVEKIKAAYNSAVQAIADLEEYEAEEGPLDEEMKAEFLKNAEIAPELEAEYKKILEKENKIFKNMAVEEMKNPEHKTITAEDMDEILQQVIEKEGILNEEEAEAFFDE